MSQDTFPLHNPVISSEIATSGADTPIERVERVMAEHPWTEPEVLSGIAESILGMNASYRIKHSKLVKLADEFNQAVKPQAACREGCCYCCSMPTLIYRYEAKLLEKVSGRSMVELPYRPEQVVLAAAIRKYGEQCPFVVLGRCSVYDNRPMICRLHHSLNKDPRDCDTSTPIPMKREVGMFDPDFIETRYHRLVRSHRPKEPWGAITEFFPA